MSNFSPLPHPPGVFSRVLLHLSIWPRPTSHAIEPTVLLKVSGVGTIEFKMGAALSKPGPVEEQGKGIRLVRNLYTSAHGWLLPFSV